MFYKRLWINNVLVNNIGILFYLAIFIMEVYKKCIKPLFVCIVVCLPCFSIASWKETACKNVDLQDNTCKSVSNDYKQPFCITNVNRNSGNGDVNNVNSCIWPIDTNGVSLNINSETSTKALINRYCDFMLSESSEWRIYFAISNERMENYDWQQTFDSQQSLFLYALCSSFDTDRWKNSLVKGAYKWDIVKLLKLQQKSDWEDLCSLDGGNSLNKCDIGIYVTKIFEWLMSDLFKIKYAQVLHVDSSENFDAKKKVEEFMKGYFMIDGWYDKYLKKNYSKTISALESDQKYYKNVLNSVKIIDNSKMVSLAKRSGCLSGWNIKWTDFVACALHASQWTWISLTPSFLSLVYNELLHYRHFVSYYTYVVGQKKSLEEEVKILDFQKYADMQVEAFKLAQHSFEEFSMTYPLHIWMLLYIEKVEKFRNSSLAKVVPLFYSLSEKLQNVQEPTS